LLLVLFWFGCGQLFVLNDFVATNVSREETAVALEFVVVDGRTKAPVPGARVQVSMEDSLKGNAGTTGPDGTVRLEVLCDGSRRVGWFTEARAVYLVGWQLQVSCAGYAPVGPTSLADFTEARRSADDCPPPPITVELSWGS
jgi:hypothetical protein